VSPINAQTSYAIFVPLIDNLIPSVFYTGDCMIRIKSHGWNKEIKRPDRPVGQRACGFGGRLIEKNRMEKMAPNAGYSNEA
jgi:hypothetical protein